MLTPWVSQIGTGASHHDPTADGVRGRVLDDSQEQQMRMPDFPAACRDAFSAWALGLGGAAVDHILQAVIDVPSPPPPNHPNAWWR